MEEPPQLRTAPESLALPLLPSPRLRLARRVLYFGLLLYLLELVLTGHWLAAATVALVVAAGCWPWRRAGHDRPRQLVVASDGRVFLRMHDDRVEAMQLRPESLRLGPHVLLVLSNGGRAQRLLLGPDNLAPAQLSALQCRLPPGAAAPGTALHSPAAPRRSSPP